MRAVGFTGTRDALPYAQIYALSGKLFELAALSGYDELHHGDCIGADSTAHRLAKRHDYRRVIHPPLNRRYRAFCTGEETRAEEKYWARNRRIVEETDMLIACPKEGTSASDWRYSGTWYTINYANDLGRRVAIIFPDGFVA